VPVAFGYPRASGPRDQDDTMKQLFDLLGSDDQQLPAPRLTTLAEAGAIRSFFVRP
jgi:hypothetical protein